MEIKLKWNAVVSITAINQSRKIRKSQKKNVRKRKKQNQNTLSISSDVDPISPAKKATPKIKK